jgi:acetyl esterase/lipase
MARMDVPAVSWLLLALATVGAAAAWTALVPGRRMGWGNVFWFLSSFVVAELALFNVLAGLTVLGVLAAVGALAATPGRIGALLIVLSCIALLIVQWRACGAARALDRALDEGLGRGTRTPATALVPKALSPPPPGARLSRPFRFDDERIEPILDLRYGDEHPRQRLDLYRPRADVHGAPVLLQIHGGGWQYGDKRRQGRPLMQHLASRGWVCAAINYRLCPRDRFPAALIDAKLAVAWLRQHVTEYGGDPDFIAVTGGSAGGHLATLVALTAHRRDLQPGFESVDTRVAACVPFYGVYDFLDRDGARRDDGAVTRLLRRVVMPCEPEEDPALWDLASPVAQVHADAPPFFVLHGTYDSLAKIEEARAFVARLRAVSRSPVVHAELPAAQHAWDLVHSVRAERSAWAVARFLETVRAAR